MFESKLRFPMVSLNDSLSVYLFVRYCPCGERKGMLCFVLLKNSKVYRYPCSDCVMGGSRG